MKNIKKVMAMIMIVAIMFGGVVFGEVIDSSLLNLSTTVQGVAEIKIADATAATPSGFNGATEVTSWEFEEGDLESDPLYLLVKTNKKDAFSINVKVKDMISTEVSTYITYDIKSSGAILATSTSVETTSLLFSIPASTTSGVRVLSYEFTVALKSDTSATVTGTYENAIASAYTAAITFELATP
jgi:hypothetical protein